MSDQGLVRRWAGAAPKAAKPGEVPCGATSRSDRFVCVLARGHSGPHKSALGVRTEIGASSSVLATWITRADGSEVGARRAVLDGRIMSATAAGSGGWGRPTDKRIAEVRAELDTEAKLVRSHRRKQAERRAELAERKEKPAARRVKFCGEKEPGCMRVCTLAPGHDGDHDSKVQTWPQGAAENLNPCPAEDARGFACSKVAGHDGEHHNVRGWAERTDEVVDELFTADNAERWWWGYRGQLGHVHAKKYSGDMAPVLDARAHPLIGPTVVGPFLLAVGEGQEQAERRIREVLDELAAPEPDDAQASNTTASRTPRGEEKRKKMEAIDQIRLDRIAPDPAQPRKHFDETKLNELATSIGKHGVQSPICVRPVVGKAGHYTIIFGERRWRASEIAGLDTIPAIVDTEADDDPAALLERQLVENAQREDIHPLEEGEALSALHTKHGHSIEELMAKVGKSRSHVYARIKLTELAPGVKKAMLDGRLPHAHGELIGRIPDHKLQEQCCKEVLGEVADKTLYEIEDLGVRHEAVNPDGERSVMRSDGKRQVLSFRATATLVRRRYQTKLSLATFDPGDGTLTPAGACGPCPHNSANQPELPGIVATAKPEGHCGNLPCFEKKTAAQFKRAADAARADGKKVIEGKKAEAMFYGNGELTADSGFVAPDQRLPYDVVASYDNKLTFKKLLGKHIDEVPKAIVQDERGAAVEVLDREKALEVLREHKLLPKKGASSSPSKPTAAEKRAKEKKKEEKAQEKLREEAFPFLLTQAVGAAKTLPVAKAPALWRLVGLFLREFLDYAAGELYRKMNDNAEPHDDIGERLENLKSEGDLRGLVVELLLIQAADDITSGAGVTDEAMELATKLLGLDWKKAEKYALDKRALDRKTEAAEKKVDAAKAKKGGK